MFKRLTDIAISAFGLLLASPVLLPVMFLVWREDGHSPFYIAKRVGRAGKPFAMVKMRSMVIGADKKGGASTSNDDRRITPVGAFIRRYKIDELTQLWNVLKGDMSVVGPRPSPFTENQYCPAWREARLSVRPGVTGLWQIRRTRAEGTDFQEWIKYDIEYVERESFLLDFIIIWKTVLLVLRKVSRL